MAEEGDTPTISGVVQSTSMESLNDELNPKTDKPQQDLKSGNNIQHEISGFKKFLTTSAQVIRFYWMPILISSIVCFVFNSDIAEVSLARNLFALFFNVFAILLMITLIEGKKDSLVVKMECEVKSKSAEIRNLQRKLEAKQAGFDHHKEECKSEKKVLMVQIKSKSVESENLKRELKEKQAGFDQHKEECKSEKKTLAATMSYNSKFKSAEIKKLKKMEGELKSRISQLEDEAKTAKIQDNRKPIELTTCAKFADISKLEDGVKVLSQPTELDGITWKTSVAKRGEYFDFFLNSENKNAVDWCCLVIAEFRLICEESNEIVHRDKRKLICDAEERIESISLKNLFDKKKGIVKDDSIIVAVEIRAFPTGIHEASLGFEKVRENLRNLLDRTNEMTIRARFTEISKLTEEPVDSEWTEFAGFSWRIYLLKEDGHLGIYLKQKKSDEMKWSCAVFGDFQLLSQQDDSIVDHYEFKEPRVFDGSYDWGGVFKNITFEDLLKGDAVKDDSIIAAVVARVFPSN